MITTEGIRAVGSYLLGVLGAEKSVRFSRFYNDSPGVEEELVRGSLPFVKDPECCSVDDLREEGLTMLNFAAWQLEDFGVVRTTFLNELLIDGEPDFVIEITERGECALAEGPGFRFRLPGYSITATPASEWLILFLDGGGSGQTLTLSDVMEYGDSDGEVKVPDDFGNEYRLGTGSYAWAFEVSLWHHARAGHISPVFQNEEQRRLWSEFVNQTSRPPRPTITTPRPLWDVPFRLAEGVNVSRLRHVGRVS
jgi:hypothetical protein